MVCRQGRGLCGMDVSGHTQDEVGMRGEITSPEALIVRHWQDLMQVRPLRSHGALNSKRTCACFNALPYLLRQTTHIPFCSPSDSLSHPHSMHSWYPLIMSSSNTSPARWTSQISLVTLASFHQPPHHPLTHSSLDLDLLFPELFLQPPTWSSCATVDCPEDVLPHRC